VISLNTDPAGVLRDKVISSIALCSSVQAMMRMMVSETYCSVHPLTDRQTYRHTLDEQFELSPRLSGGWNRQLWGL